MIKEVTQFAEALSITKRVEFIDKREFAAVILDENDKILVVYVFTFSAALVMQVYLFL